MKKEEEETCKEREKADLRIDEEKLVMRGKDIQLNLITNWNNA